MTTHPATSRLTLRALARLLAYPGAELRDSLPALRQAMHSEGALSSSSLGELEGLLRELGSGEMLDTEAAYVDLFDRGRATSLHLFEHVHGDSRDRGPAMIDLEQTYARAGLLLEPGELPDYLPAVLEFASTQPPGEARAFLGELAHILNAIGTALQQRRSAYAAAISALLEIAGEPQLVVTLPPEEALDASWAEPPAFDGCSKQGQAKPGQPQPIHIVKHDALPAQGAGVSAKGATA